LVNSPAAAATPAKVEAEEIKEGWVVLRTCSLLIGWIAGLDS